MFILFQLLSPLIFFPCLLSAVEFSPDTSDYNAYGLKVAANDHMIVEALNDYGLFLIQFAPFTNDTEQTTERSCYIEYDDESQYIYSVALGKNQQKGFFYVGETTGIDQDDRIENRTFVGFTYYNDSFTSITCDGTFFGPVEYVSDPYPHQEHLVMTTGPDGLTAYGFSEFFTFSYTAYTYDLVVHPNNSLSPSTAFFPFAVDYDGNRSVIAGFRDNGRNSRVKYIPTIILFSIDTSTAIATPIASWNYSINSTAWQAGLTNAGANQYAPKFDMSVSMNPTVTQVLVGIQSMNMVFRFSYTSNTLSLVASIDNGRGLGFGKGVAWLSNTSNDFAILANVYSMNYVWSSSKIDIYDSPLMNTSTPISIFPNIQQPLYSYMSSVFLNIVTTPSHLVLMDDLGNLFVIVSAISGYYPSTVGPTVQVSPAFSSQMPCIAGTYKNVTGIRRCFPCPSGTKNDGSNSTITTCVNCATNAFCPFGSATDSISNDQLSNVSQAVTYPKSPDITGLDDILFFTLFSIGSSGRCVPLSPIFWTLIVAAIVIIIGGVMIIIKFCVKNPKIKKPYKKIETALKQTDLVREGDMWAGGLATFCVIVLCVSCIVFSAKYYNSYPIETVGPSTYTCDTTIRNAQFSTSLQSLSIPVADNIQSMIDLLDGQAVNLDVSFINTVYNCTSDVVTLNYQLGTTWRAVSPSPSCNSSGYIVSYSALLPFRLITVQFTLPNIYTIGGIRVGLSAPGQNKSSTATLQVLSFSQTFSRSGLMLGQDAYINLQLTKVINNTNPLVTGNDEVLSGIWIGSSSINYYESFFSDSDYLYAPSQSSTNVTIIISETPYFIFNEESPIARLPEIIFHDFLFVTMIIGMFVLIFVIIEVMILPCASYFIHKCKGKSGDKYRTDSSRSSGSSDVDLEDPDSNPNKQKNNELKHNNVKDNNFTSLHQQPFTVNEYPDRTQYDDQQRPPTRNRQAYL